MLAHMRRPERIEPGPGQESVWDYPRPPRLEPTSERIRVIVGGEVIADSTSAVRVLETSQAPAYYLPRDDVRMDLLVPTEGSTSCEWKGSARYFTIVSGGSRAERAAWTYDDPAPAFASIAGHLAFYPQRVDRCLVGDEAVEPNGGDFYGGWITSRIVGPFKGADGTVGW
jgi:uncharacterized protein (DUF427 family)